MANIEELKLAVGELMKIDPETFIDSTPLNGLLASSIGRARLDATLRSRLGISNPGVYTVQTFGELCQLVGVGGASSTTAPTVATTPSLTTAAASATNIAIGVDIQAISALPEEADYWDGDFYQQHFTSQEIAYALLQPHPRDSFAAAWCAKEALRKADDRWVHVDWKQIEITHDAAGKPMLRSGGETIPCSVSLSHADGFALAVVAVGATPAPPQPNISAAATPVIQYVKERSGLSLVLPVVALLVSLVSAAYCIFK
jgi:holo-[acyl-carrier protein] synthase